MHTHTGTYPANAEEAEALAITALGFIAADPELLGRFLTASGIGPETLRSAAREPGFLRAVTGYLMANEPALLAFTANNGLKPEAVVRADAHLNGGHGYSDAG